jgi:hypothetical protein
MQNEYVILAITSISLFLALAYMILSRQKEDSRKEWPTILNSPLTFRTALDFTGFCLGCVACTIVISLILLVIVDHIFPNWYGPEFPGGFIFVCLFYGGIGALITGVLFYVSYYSETKTPEKKQTL